MNCIRRHRRKISGQNCRERRNNKRIEHSGPNRQCTLCEQIVPVFQQMRTRYRRKARRQLPVGTGCIDKQYVKPKQTQGRYQHQNKIGNRSSGPQCQPFFIFIIICPIHDCSLLFLISVCCLIDEHTQNSGYDKQKD